MLLFDAAGLGPFAVAGTQKALAFGLHPVMAAALGMLTGTRRRHDARWTSLTEIPIVLRADLYAVAAPAGAAVVVVGHHIPFPSDWGGDRRRCPLLWAPVHGSSSWLASSRSQAAPSKQPSSTSKNGEDNHTRRL